MVGIDSVCLTSLSAERSGDSREVDPGCWYGDALDGESNAPEREGQARFHRDVPPASLSKQALILSTHSPVIASNPRAPRVVMLVLNAFRHDTRVEKQAKMLVEAGCDVVVIAIQTGEELGREWRDGYRVLRIPPTRTWLAGFLLFRVLRCHRFPPFLLARIFGFRVVEEREEGDAIPRPRQRPTIQRRRRSSLSGNGDQRMASAGFSLMKPLKIVAIPFVLLFRVLFGIGRQLRRVVRRSAVGVRNLLRDFGPARFFLLPISRVVSRFYRGCRRLLRRTRRFSHQAIFQDFQSDFPSDFPSDFQRFSKRFSKRFVKRMTRPIIRRMPTGLKSLGNDLVIARLTLALDPDLVVAHDTNTLPVALVVHRVIKTRFIFDSHELFLERNLPEAVRATERWLWKVPERDGVRAASLRYSVSSLVCEELRNRYRVEFEERSERAGVRRRSEIRRPATGHDRSLRGHSCRDLRWTGHAGTRAGAPSDCGPPPKGHPTG